MRMGSITSAMRVRAGSMGFQPRGPGWLFDSNDSGDVQIWLVPRLRVKISPNRLIVPRCTVVRDSPDQIWFQRYLEFHCDDCGSETGFRSRRRTFSERYLLPVFLLQPVRCSECFRRDYRLLFVPVKERLPEAVKKMATSAPRADRNVA